MVYVFLWGYVVGYALIWGYLPILEWNEQPPRVRWVSVLIHWVATAAMIVSLTEIKMAGVPSALWWALLVAVATITVIEDGCDEPSRKIAQLVVGRLLNNG